MDFKMHSLRDAFVEIQRYCASYSLPKEACYNINLVCEELIVNLLKYTRTSGYNLVLSPDKEMTMINLYYQADRFDPTVVPKQEKKSVEKMHYGGLGLMLVNSLALKIEYQYNEKQSLNVVKVIL